MLAELNVVIWAGGLLLLGILGFVVMTISLVLRFVAWLFHALFGIGGRPRPAANPARHDARRMLCPHPGCGYRNRPTALFCGRCGRSLRRSVDIDAYG